MITEDQLEQLAIQWFQDTGWNYVNGKVISPEGEVRRRGAMPGQVMQGATHKEFLSVRQDSGAVCMKERRRERRSK